MSALTDKLVSIASFAVGASATYPVVEAVSLTDEIVADEGVAGEPVFKRTWKFRSLALAAAANQVGALAETLKSTLCRRGQAVTFTELGGAARTLAAAGGSGGCLVGYPVVSITLLPSVGAWQEFEVTIVAMVPNPQGVVASFNLVKHSYRVETETDSNGNVTTRQTGTVRVRNDQQAEQYIQNLIFTPAESAAEAAGHYFSTRTSRGPDLSEATYSYEDKPKGDTPFDGDGVDEVEVNDRTNSESGGRITRTISGYATGTGAAAFAAAQQPSVGTNELLVRKEIGQPRIPDGRVDFSYEVRKGRTVAGFTGIVVYGYEESISETPGDRDVSSSMYLDADPLLFKTERRPYQYTQRTRMDFTGPWSGANPALLMDDDNRKGPPRATRSSTDAGMRTLEVTQDYIYASGQTLPTPFEVPPLS